MAAIVIVVLGLLATLGLYVNHPSQPDNLYVEFGSNVINVLSIGWIVFVLARYERANDADFGKAIRREVSTILLMIFVSGAYSLLSLLKALPWSVT